MFKTEKYYQHAEEYCSIYNNKIPNLLIKHKHKILSEKQSEVESLTNTIKHHMTREDADIVLLKAEHQLQRTLEDKIKTRQRRKYEVTERTTQRQFHMHNNNNWFVNKSNAHIPTNIQWLLLLGPNHSLPTTRQKFAVSNHVPDFDNVDIIQKENNYDKRFMLGMLHIVDIPPDKRLNYKTDIDNCSQSYKHLIKKFRVSRK